MKHQIYTVAVQTFLSLPLVVATCYSHSDANQVVGAEAVTDLACSSSEFSACCGDKWTCLSDARTAVCQWGSSWTTGSCTDQSWSSDACPKFCDAGHPNETFYALDLCTSDNGTFVFCCGNDDSCDCSTGVNTFRIINESFTGLASSSFVEPSSTTSLTTTSILSSIEGTETVLPSTLSPIFSTTSNLVTSSLTSSVTSGLTSSITTSPIASTSSPDPLPAPRSDNHNVAIGAGVGIPLGLLALTSIAFLIHRERHNRKIIQHLRQDNGDLAGVGNGIEVPGNKGIEKPRSNGIEQPSGNGTGTPKVQGVDEAEWRGHQAS